MKRKKDLLILSIVIGLIFSVIPLSIISSKQTMSYLNNYYFNFENNLQGWNPSVITEGSLFSISTSYAYTDNASVKLEGRTAYNYNFQENEDETIIVTNNTFLSFAWRFENKEGYYMGLSLGTDFKGLFIMSHFSGTYANNSDYGVIQFQNEEKNVWHYHSVNISKIYWEIYTEIPNEIKSIRLLHRGYGSVSPPEPCSQISYYDSIHFVSNTISTEPNVTTSNSMISFSINSQKVVISIFSISLIALIFHMKKSRKK